MEEAGAYEDAKKAYKATLDLTPGDAAASDALKALLGNPTDHFATARTLAQHGELKAARENIWAVIKARPSLQIPDDLTYLFGGRWEFWRNARHLALDVGPSAVEVGLVLVFLFLVLFFLYRIGLAIPSMWGWFSPKLILETVGDGGASAANKAVFEAELGSTLLSVAREDRSLKLIAGPVESIALPTVVGKVFPTSEGLAGLVGELLKLIPIPPYRVAATLHAPKGGSPGVALSLQRKNKVLKHETLWLGSFASASAIHKEEKAQLAYGLLAEIAAVWLLFEVGSCGLLRSPYGVLGTANWRAFALFRVGVRAHDSEEQALAEECFESAINTDPDFAPARVNLAWCLFMKDREKARKHLKLVDKRWRETKAKISIEEGTRASEKSRQVDWRSKDTEGKVESEWAGWEILYKRLKIVATVDKHLGNWLQRRQLAWGALDGWKSHPVYYKTGVGLLGLGVEQCITRENEERSKLGNEVRSEACRVVEELHLARVALHSFRRRAYGRFRRLLAARDRQLRAVLEDCVQVLRPRLVGLELLLAGQDETAMAKAKERAKELQAETKTNRTPLFLYDVATLLAIQARVAPEERLQEEAVTLLRDAVTLKKAHLAHAKTDLAFGELRETQAYKQAFDGLDAPQARTPDASPSSPLERLSLVGKCAEGFSDRGIRTLERLVLTMAAKTERASLALALGLSDAYALRLARLAELTRIPGITVEHMDLLVRVDTACLADLALADPRRLVRDMESAAKSLGFDLNLAEATAGSWVRKARELRTFVES